MKQLEEEQRKLYDKDDEIMALNDKLTQETEVSSDLRETIKENNERIKELEDELAKRPEIKDDSSSSSEEKVDNSAEIEEWKKKYESMVGKNERLTSDFEKFKIKAEAEIEELTISVTNLEKRNIELKLLLRRNNIDLEGSPTKVGSSVSSSAVENISSTVVENREEATSVVKKSKKVIHEEVEEEEEYESRT